MTTENPSGLLQVQTSTHSRWRSDRLPDPVASR